MVRRVRALGAALVVGVGTLAAPADAQPWVPSCAPVEVIQAAGTGFSHSWHPSARTTLFDDGSSPAHDLQERFGAARVRHYQVKYPATLGRFNAFGARGNLEGSEAATYGESVAIGRDDAVLEMRTVARHCPGTRFVLVGYSQGAHLIGDAAAMVAAGEVPGVGPDQIAAVVLFADPARAPLTSDVGPSRPARLYAPAPAGVRGANFETIQTGGTALDPARVGMAGPRARSFDGLEGKVLSLCNAADLACATPPSSVIRAVADVAAREVRIGPPNPVTGMRTGTMAALLAQGVPFGQALRESGLSLLDVTTLLTTLFELALVFDAASTATLVPDGLPPGAPPTPPEQRLAVALLAALPNLAMEGVTWPYLLTALHGLRDRLPAGDARDWFDAALEAMHLADASEHLYRQLAAAGVVPRVPTPTEGRQALTHAVVSSGVQHVLSATGLDAAARANPSLVADAQSAGDFGPQHFAYYKLGYTDGFSVGGPVGSRTGYEYAVDWTSQVIEGVLAGR